MDQELRAAGRIRLDGNRIIVEPLTSTGEECLRRMAEAGAIIAVVIEPMESLTACERAAAGEVDFSRPGPDGIVWVPPGVYETDGRSGILRRVGDLPEHARHEFILQQGAAFFGISVEQFRTMIEPLVEDMARIAQAVERAKSQRPDHRP